MTSKSPCLKLSTGYDIPQIGLGTWQSQPDVVGSAIDCALKIGYRHIDCAYVYQNEAEIGVTLAKHLSQGTVKRDELFVTAKVWNTFHSYQRASLCIDTSLKNLQVSYLDMCLIHWPMGYFEGGADLFPMEDGKPLHSDVDYLETWKAMEDAVNAGKIKSIGLSNFSIPQMQRVIDNAKIKPSINQVESHPYLAQLDLIDFCASNKILVCAYSPLGNPGSKFWNAKQLNLLDEPVLKEIAKRHSKTASQIALKWAVQRGTIVIPKSVQKNHLEENFSIWDFQLSDEDMKAIYGLNRNSRFITLDRDSRHTFYPFK